MNEKSSLINQVMVDAIPLNPDIKDYFVRKYIRLSSTRGEKFAAGAFKALRETTMSFIADYDHSEASISAYADLAPFGRKSKHMICKLLRAASGSPHDVINLLKLYTSSKDPLQTVEEASSEMHSELNSISAKPTPLIWRLYADALFNALWYLRALTKKSHLGPSYLDIWSQRMNQAITRLNRELARNGFHHYHASKRSVTVPCDMSVQQILSIAKLLIGKSNQSVSAPVPIPQSYKDYDRHSGTSKQFDNDLANFSFLPHVYPWITDDLVASLESRSDSGHSYNSMMLNEHVFNEYDEEFSPFIGQIHHIPKKGTTVRRSIAVPNRFVQALLEPFAQKAYGVLSNFPQDCTYNQNKFDYDIQTRLNQRKYVGSVDLHHATDYLPFSWFTCIFDDTSVKVSDPEKDRSQAVLASYEVFKQIPKAQWANGTFSSSWEVGQPLGTLPSFAVLGITHNLLALLSCYAAGTSLKNYCVLGDDIIFMHRKAREFYIRFMNAANIPLSMHKSYDGRMVEFAGKIFIANQQWRYSTDHSYLTWSNLFDWQRSTKTPVPFTALPSKIRRRWSRHFKCSSDAESAYRTVTLWYTLRKDQVSSYSEAELDQIREFCSTIERLSQEDWLPQDDRREWFTYKDWLVLSESHQRQRHDWFMNKFRPVATDKLARLSAEAVREAKPL